MHKETGHQSSSLSKQQPCLSSHNLLLATHHPFPSDDPPITHPHLDKNATDYNIHHSNFTLSLQQPQQARYRPPHQLDSHHPVHCSKLPIASSSKLQPPPPNIQASQILEVSPPHPTSSQPPCFDHLPPPTPEIPSIHQIVQRYSLQLNHSNIPLKPSPSLKKHKLHPNTSTSSQPTPPLRPSTPHQFHHLAHPTHSHNPPLASGSSSTIGQNGHGKIPKKNSPTISCTQSEALSDDGSISSIHSLTREALKLPQPAPFNFDSVTPSFRSGPQPTTSFDQPTKHLQKQTFDSNPASKRFNSIHEPGSPYSSTPCTQAETDDHIAQYLRSSQLTTLIKLERQQSPMTVSLADVGSSTGHPVIVYLGLGCVRYLVGLYDELAEALGLRLICIDRWGLGKTTEVPDDQRSFTEWASVVEEVVDQLGIHKFSILAHSAGAPYALASSIRFGDRIHGSIHLLAPWVDMTSEGGVDAGAYKWLRYIPNSMIKTVQTAEWKMTGWRLGKLPKLNYPPVGFDACPATPAASPPRSLYHPSTTHCDSSSGLQNTNMEPQQHQKKPKTPTPSNSSSGSSHTNHQNCQENQKDDSIIPITTDTAESNNNPIIRRRTSSNWENPNQVSDNSDFLIEPPNCVLVKIERKESLIHTSNNGNLRTQQVIKASQNYEGFSANPSHDADHHHKESSNCSSTTTTATVKTKPAQIRQDSEDSCSDLSHPPLMRSASIQRSVAKTKSQPVGHYRLQRPERSSNTISEAVTTSSSTSSSPSQGFRPQRKIKNSTSSSICSNQSGTHHVKESTKEGGEMKDSGIGGMGRTLGISLLQASYSESLKGGASDLITILEKDSKKKPWGFKYSEITKPVKIWHGDKDEKLSVKGSEFFLSSILLDDVKKHSKLFIVKDANHSLMTNVNVLFQVFESISDQWSLPRPCH